MVETVRLVGRPTSTDPRKYRYHLRLNGVEKERLFIACNLSKKSKSEVLREALWRYTEQLMDKHNAEEAEKESGF